MKEKFEQKVREWASWLSSKTEVMLKEVQSKNLTLEDIIAIIIKIIIVVITISILKWPFYIIEHGGRFAFGDYSMEVGFWFGIWALMLKLLYWILSLLIIFIVFQDELLTNQKKKPNKLVKEEPKKAVSKMTEDNPYNILWLIFKIVVFLVITLPLIIANIGLVFAISSVIYLIVKGVFLYGLLILFIGIFWLNVFIINTINSLFKGKKIKIWSLVVASILLLVGIFGTLDWALGLKFKQGNAVNVTEDMVLMSRTNFEINRSNFNDVPFDIEYVEDETIPADKVLVKVTYDKNYLDYVSISNSGEAEVRMDNLYEFKAFSEEFIKYLKQDIIYIPYIDIEVRATEDTIDIIER